MKQSLKSGTKQEKKLYVVKKYVWARNAAEAIKIEKSRNTDDVWIDEEWKRNQSNPKDAIGFYAESD